MNFVEQRKPRSIVLPNKALDRLNGFFPTFDDTEGSRVDTNHLSQIAQTLQPAFFAAFIVSKGALRATGATPAP